MPSDISRPVRIVAAVLVALVTAFVALTFAASASAAVSQRSVYYTYDLMGRQLTAKFDSVGGSDGITNAYNGFGDLTATTSSTSGTARTVTYAYDGAGRRTQVTHPDGQAFTYAYDNLSRLSGVYQGIGTGTPLDTFSYGTNGLVSSRVETGGSSVAYGWDDAGRLTSQTDAFAGGTGNVGWTFGFNPASQIVSESRTNDAYAWTGAVGVNRPYAVNGLNQYTSAGPANFTYDANGNLTGDGTWTYAYDVENRLVSAVGGGISATLRYDPLGRLSFIGGSNIGDVQFLYDGDALVLEFNSANAIINRYVHGSNAAADDPLVWYSSATVSSATRHWLHADHLGSIVARTDASGANPVINTYDEYGIPGSANTGRFGYTGQTWLYEIGLDYYKARIYSPTLGRFLQTDPIGYEGGVNLYLYASADPLNIADHTGLYDSDCTGSRLCSGQGISSGSSGSTTASPSGSLSTVAEYNSNNASGADSLFNQANWVPTQHNYSVGPFFICTDTPECMAAILNVFPSFIVPNLGRAVSDGQISPIYPTPETSYSIGHVLTRISSDGLRATNLTMPDHKLCCGQVDIANFRGNGGWFVGAHGYGTNRALWGPVNQYLGPEIFRSLLGTYIMVVRSRLSH